MTEKIKYPPFFYDGEENKNPLKYEAILDWWMSWTIRCAVNSNTDEKLRKESCKILSEILFEKQENFDVLKCETWKQDDKIDLYAEISIERNGVIENFIVTFENKMYANFQPNQLKRYFDIQENFYGKIKENDIDKYIRKYILLTADYEGKNSVHGEEAFQKGWRWTTPEELKEKAMLNKTGNALFDEFWFNYYQ